MGGSVRAFGIFAALGLALLEPQPLVAQPLDENIAIEQLLTSGWQLPVTARLTTAPRWSYSSIRAKRIWCSATPATMSRARRAFMSIAMRCAEFPKLPI